MKRVALHALARCNSTAVVASDQARSWGGCRGVCKSLRSVNSIASAKIKILIIYGKGTEGKRKRANPSGQGVSGQHAPPPPRNTCTHLSDCA